MRAIAASAALVATLAGCEQSAQDGTKDGRLNTAESTPAPPTGHLKPFTYRSESPTPVPSYTDDGEDEDDPYADDDGTPDDNLTWDDSSGDGTDDSSADSSEGGSTDSSADSSGDGSGDDGNAGLTWDEESMEPSSAPDNSVPGA